MNPRVILSIIIICAGFVAAILPQKQNSSIELDARQLLYELQLENHLISVDEMANALSNNDPEYQLIDLRTEEEFKLSSLPGALNIPISRLFDPEFTPYLDQVARKNVFYSNGTTLSSQAWMLTRQKGYKNNYILQGGLNHWHKTVLQPEKPESTMDIDALRVYQTRLGARQFFTGDGGQSNMTSAAPKKPVPAKKKTKVSGGCS